MNEPYENNENIGSWVGLVVTVASQLVTSSTILFLIAELQPLARNSLRLFYSYFFVWPASILDLVYSQSNEISWFR